MKAPVTINNYPNVLRKLAAIKNRYMTINARARLPENTITFIASNEVATGFVVRRLVYFYTDHVTVIQNNQPPAIDGLKATGAANPRQAINLPDKISFLH